MSVDRLRKGIVSAARELEAEYEKEPTVEEVAVDVVFYDTMGLCGFRKEMAELRAKPDPTRFVLEVLKEDTRWRRKK